MELEEMSRFVLGGTDGFYTDHVRVVSDNDLKWYRRRTEVEAAIERSIRNASFEVVYQPIIRVDSMKVYSVEALTRLKDDTIGEVFPDEFIPLAERLDVISYITEGVMSRSARLMSSGGLMELGINRMHVNISGTECMRADANGKLRGIAEDNKLDPYVMCLEISETAVPGENNAIGEGIVSLHESGMGIVLDDYGTGYSNMTGIVALPIDLVKIDRSFLRMALEDAKVMVMLKDIIDMIHDMERKVLVTGIEDEESFDIMAEAGIDYAQGFYFSKPVPEKELLEYVSNVNKYGMSPVREDW
jgi:EAL domain-containing protein (putative c-di-GMP-specific phosphodiesterase class I)